MKSTFRTYDVIGFRAEGNTLLKRQQYLYEGIEIAQHIIANKIDNQRKMLMKLRVRSDESKTAIADLKKYSERVFETKSIQEIMGLEGTASRAYFANYFDNCEWKGRQPRAKRDYVNVTLDIGYTMLFNYIESLLCYFGFDVYVGVLHKEFYQRKSLVCDLVEPFRPLIDNCIRNAISLGQCKEEDFSFRDNKFMLDWNHNKQYVLYLLKPILDNKDAMFRYVRDFYRAFAKQVPASEFPIFEI